MTKNFRVSNLSRGYSLKMKQAERAVTECVATWVEYGVSIRDLTIAEAIAARNQQASLREPLAYAEIPGLHFEPSEAMLKAHLNGMALAWEAQVFASKACAA